MSTTHEKEEGFSSNTAFTDEENDNWDDDNPSIIFKIIGVLWIMMFAFCLYRMRRADRENQEIAARRRIRRRQLREERERQKKDKFSVKRRKTIKKHIVTCSAIGPDDNRNNLPNKEGGSLNHSSTKVDVTVVNPKEQQKHTSHNDITDKAKPDSNIPQPASSNTMDQTHYSFCTNERESNETLCPICLDDIHSGEDLSWSKEQKCRHVFHSSCLTAWLMEPTHNDCPVCRTVLLPKDIENAENGDQHNNRTRNATVRTRRPEPQPVADGSLYSVILMFLEDSNDDYFDDDVGDEELNDRRTTNGVLDSLVSFIVPQRFRPGVLTQEDSGDVPVVVEQEQVQNQEHVQNETQVQNGVQDRRDVEVEMATFDTVNEGASDGRNSSNRDGDNHDDVENGVAVGSGLSRGEHANISGSDADNERFNTDLGRRKRKKDKRRYHSLDNGDSD